MRFIFSMYIVLFFSITLFAQNKNDAQEIEQEYYQFVDDFYDADAYMYEDNYIKAVELLEKIVANGINNANIQYRLGFSYLRMPLHKDKAIPHLLEATKSMSATYQDDKHGEKNAPFDALFYLAKAYHITHKFNEAIDVYSDFQAKLLEFNLKTDLNEEATRQMEICDNAIELIKYPVDVTTKNLGGGINSKYSDHSPVLYVDENTLLFTSKREGSTGGEQLLDGQYYEDVYKAEFINDEWSNVQKVKGGINTINHDACIAISVDGQDMYLYRDEDGSGNIFKSKLKDNEWGAAKKLKNNINTRAVENHVSISSDNKTLFFTSSRKGGYGGYDIYKSSILPNGEWGEPFNLGPNVNTKYNEASPFIHYDGKTLFFSSKGHHTMGGYDVFYCTINDDGTTTEPINVGYPINNVGDDESYVVMPSGKRMYYSSVKEGGYGYEDLYLIYLKNGFARPMALVTGNIKKEGSSNFNYIDIDVVDEKMDESIGSFIPRKDNGKYICILATERKYHITYSCAGYQDFEKEILIKKDDNYEKKQQAYELEDIVLKKLDNTRVLAFDNKSKEINNEISTIINTLVDDLTKNADAKFMISQAKDSKELFAERKNVVLETLQSKEIDNSRYIESKPKDSDVITYDLVIYEKPYVEKILAENKNNDKQNNNIEETNKQNKPNFKKSASAKSKLEAKDDFYITGEQIIVYSTLFDYDNYVVKDSEKENLEQLIYFLKHNPAATMLISGYTDSKGTAKYNDILSYRRAKAVKNYLVKNGANRKNIIIKKFGDANPVASNTNADGSDNPRGRALNRRVEFVLTKQGFNGKLIFKQKKVLDKNQFENIDKTSKPKLFAVQIYSLAKKIISTIKGVSDVKEYFIGGRYKYAVGEFKDYSKAKLKLLELKKIGYTPLIVNLSSLK